MPSWERMNTHDTMSVSVEFMGETLRVSQDPNTEHLGTSVWDASIVLAKFLEKNMRKGVFARTKVAGKRVLELGSGMGLGGIAMSLMGADVTLTDTIDVLPLLRRNCELNLGKGKAHVCELDWMKPEQAAQWQAPFDIVIAADCIYHEHIVPHFHAIVMATTNEKSTVLVVNELRSHSVHAAFMTAFMPTHIVTRLPNKLMHETYQHENIQMFLCKKKRPGTKASGKDEVAEESSVLQPEELGDGGHEVQLQQGGAQQPLHGEQHQPMYGIYQQQAEEGTSAQLEQHYDQVGHQIQQSLGAAYSQGGESDSLHGVLRATDSPSAVAAQLGSISICVQQPGSCSPPCAGDKGTSPSSLINDRLAPGPVETSSAH